MSKIDLKGEKLMDQMEANKLYTEYTHKIDEFNQQGWLDTFTEDGIFDVDGTLVKGREQLSTWFAQFAEYSQKSFRHYISNVGIDIDGATAFGRAYLIVLNVSNGQIVATGTYHDTLIKSSGTWRFQQRQLRTDAKVGE